MMLTVDRLRPLAARSISSAITLVGPYFHVWDDEFSSFWSSLGLVCEGSAYIFTVELKTNARTEGHSDALVSKISVPHILVLY